MDASTNLPSANAPIAARGRAALSSVQTLTRQPAVRRALPAIVILAMAVVGMAAYLLLTGPTRLPLNTGLPESEKAAAARSKPRKKRRCSGPRWPASPKRPRSSDAPKTRACG